MQKARLKSVKCSRQMNLPHAIPRVNSGPPTPRCESKRPPINRFGTGVIFLQTPGTAGDPAMKVVVLVKFSQCAEAGVPYSEELIAQVKEFNKELVKAGLMIAVERLHPSSRAIRLQVSSGKELVVD